MSPTSKIASLVWAYHLVPTFHRLRLQPNSGKEFRTDDVEYDHLSKFGQK